MNTFYTNINPYLPSEREEMAGKTLYDKLWEQHLVKQREDGTALIYIDRQLLHEVTSPQAFEGLRIAGRQPWRIDANIATPDHNVSTDAEERKAGIEGITDPVSRIQVKTLIRETGSRSEEHTSELQSRPHLVCRLLLAIKY